MDAPTGGEPLPLSREKVAQMELQASVLERAETDIHDVLLKPARVADRLDELLDEQNQKPVSDDPASYALRAELFEFEQVFDRPDRSRGVLRLHTPSPRAGRHSESSCESVVARLAQIGLIIDPTFNARKYSNLPFASTQVRCPPPWRGSVLPVKQPCKPICMQGVRYEAVSSRARFRGLGACCSMWINSHPAM